MGLRTRSFCIYYFCDPPNFTAKSTSVYHRITASIPPGTDYLTVGQVKKEAGKAARLLPSSLKIFGLFLGDDIGLPGRFCPEGAIVPDTVTEFNFQLASFNQDIENEVVCKDENAMQLVFWELKNKWGNFGFPFSAQIECNKAFFAMYKNITQKSKISSSQILNFLQTVRTKSPIFTSHYYHIRPIEARVKEVNTNSEAPEEATTTKSMITLTYCYTTDIVATEKMAPIKEGRRQSRARFHMQRQATEPFCRWPVNLTVALNFNQLVILDALGRTEFMSLDWCSVKSFRMNIKQKIFIIDFQTLPHKTRNIAIKTDRCHFLFSVSQHIINLKCSTCIEEKPFPLQFQAVSVFLNPLFNEKSVSEKKLGYLIEEKYADIHTWVDESEENESQTRDLAEGKINNDDNSTLASLKSPATETDTPKWTTMTSIKENLQRRSSSPDKSLSIMQTPLSQLLPYHEGSNNSNMNNNKTSILSSSLYPGSVSGTTEMTSMEVGQEMPKSHKSSLCSRRSLSTIETDFYQLEEGSSQGYKGSDGKKKKFSLDTIPRVPAGKSTCGGTFKSSCARSRAQVKGKGANAKGEVLSKDKKDRSLS